MKTLNFQELKTAVRREAKSGIDFILAASIVWGGVSWIWTLQYASYNKSIFTFIIGAILLPLAYGFSKITGTNWKVKDNPLQQEINNSLTLFSIYENKINHPINGHLFGCFSNHGSG